jgi:Fic family protein
VADYAELDKLKRRLDALRPIDAQMLRAIREKFRLEWTYHSNALEGNPLTLSETSFFIREGLTSKGRPLSAYLETTNHIEALEYLDSVVKDGRPITEHLVRLYHTMLFNKMDKISLGSGADRQETPIIGGQYKQQNNHVVRLDGKILQFTDVSLVPAEMEQLIRWYEETKAQLHPAELATQFHHRLVRIHPFLDGNGRVSRLLLNTILMRADYVPAIIPVEEKKQYLEALQSADDGDYEPLYGFIEAQVSKTLRLTLDIIEGREVFDLDDLTRMVQNITRKAKDIQRDLGPATEPPEKRAGITVAKIMQDVSRLVREHVQKTTIPGLNIAAADVPGMPVQVVPLFNQLIARFGPGRGPTGQSPALSSFSLQHLADPRSVLGPL